MNCRARDGVNIVDDGKNEKFCLFKSSKINSYYFNQ